MPAKAGASGKAWGRLLPMRRHLAPMDLTEDSYSFGRMGSDFKFTSKVFPFQYNDLPEKHFSLTRIFFEDTCIMLIENESETVPTFCNGDTLKPGQKMVLRHHDDIAIINKSTPVFMFHDPEETDQDKYPKELTDKYTISKTIAKKRDTGEVKLAFRNKDTERCAIKLLDKETHQDMSYVYGEIKNLQSLKHRCIIQLYDVVETDKTMYLVAETPDGTEIHEKGMPEKLAKLWLYQACLALSHMHENDIPHRELKPQSIIVSPEGVDKFVTVADFGMAKLARNTPLMQTIPGNRLYMAPELFNGDNYKYTPKGDLWSFGVIIYKCLTGIDAFCKPEDTTQKIIKAIKEATFDFEDPKWCAVSEEAKDLIRKFLVVDPEARIKFDQALEHPWFQDAEVKARTEELMDC